jgi:predicted aspartyl protease
MIEGRVSSREAIIRLVVSAPDGGNETELEAIVDTGFDRSLTLPPGIIADLNLTPRGETPSSWPMEASNAPIFMGSSWSGTSTLVL